MADPKRKQGWFVRERLGRSVPVNWRGPVLFVVLMAVVMAGAAAESRLRGQHPVLAGVVMGVLAIIAIALVLVINARIEGR